MKVKEITINTTTQASELVADILYEVSLSGVCIYDKNDLIQLLKDSEFWDYVEKDEFKNDLVVKVKGYFEEDQVESALKVINEKLEYLKKNSPFCLGSLELSMQDTDSDIWWENWKKTFQPIEVGEILIVPQWLKTDNKENKKVIRIDPGMAFGSGSHESTKMCLMLLQELDFKNKIVADVGTGSGILALAAAALGATNIEAYDIDSIAIDAAKRNVCLNEYQKYIKVDNSNLLSNTKNKFDIVIANITSEVLKTLCKDIKSYIRQDGIIIISGILTMYEEDVVGEYLKNGCKIKKRINMGEWVAFKLSLE